MKNYYLDKAAEKEDDPSETITYIINVDWGVDHQNVNWTYSGDNNWTPDVTVTPDIYSCTSYTVTYSC